MVSYNCALGIKSLIAPDAIEGNTPTDGRGEYVGERRSLTASGSGATIVRIADSPPSGRLRRALLLGAGLVGAAIVGLAWLFLGNDGNSGVSSSLASLGQAPGIAPPAYAYLDNPSVALYLGQLEGGIAKTEQLTQQLTQGRSAGVEGPLPLTRARSGGSPGDSKSQGRWFPPEPRRRRRAGRESACVPDG